MATNSSVAGFLLPSASPPYDDSLDDLLQATLTAVTGIAGSLCRPRWQPEPPNIPDFATDWVAFGIVRIMEDVFTYQKFDPDTNTTSVERDETIHVLHSFYGPNCAANQKRYSAGLQVAQNRDAWFSVGIKLVEVQEAVNLPALLKQKWVKRIDTTIILRRRVGWKYPILDLTGVGFGLDNEYYVTPLTIAPDDADPKFADVLLLLRGNPEPNNSTTFIDASSHQRIVGRNGGGGTAYPRVSTAHPAFGGAGIFGNPVAGNPTWLWVPAGFPDEPVQLDEWTWDCWYYRDDPSVGPYHAFLYANNSNMRILLKDPNDNGTYQLFLSINSYATAWTQSSVPLHVLTHLAVECQVTQATPVKLQKVTLYFNGVPESVTNFNNGAPGLFLDNTFAIQRHDSAGFSGLHYYDDYRITKGVRWGRAFIPPSAEAPDH